MKTINDWHLSVAFRFWSVILLITTIVIFTLNTIIIIKVTQICKHTRRNSLSDVEHNACDSFNSHASLLLWLNEEH